MSIFSELQSATTEAQSTLAQMQGMPANGTNVLFPSKETFVGVYGPPQAVNDPVFGGGYQQKTFVPLTITRDQLAAAPALKSQLMRTDVTPPITYIIDYIVPDRALDWEFHLVRYGAPPS